MRDTKEYITLHTRSLYGTMLKIHYKFKVLDLTPFKLVHYERESTIFEVSYLNKAMIEENANEQ